MRTVKLLSGLALTLLLLSGCAPDGLSHLYRLAVHQARLLSQREPIERVLEDPHAALSPEARRRLALVPDIRAFARRIGLTPGGAYTQYAPVKLKLYVVTASERARFQIHTWWWPVVGSLPYKGFFEKEKAEEEIGRLQNRALDTHVRAVRAYSTLGWFDDPIVPGMLGGNLGSFVGVILHESVHTTFFRKDLTAFNEQAAVLIERQGTQQFLEERFGRDSKDLRAYRKDLEEGERFLRALDALHAELFALYAGEGSEAGKLKRRGEIIEWFLARHPEIRERILAEEKRVGLPVSLNNAYVLAYRLYFENRDRMMKIYKRSGRDLARTVDWLKQAADAEGDPFEALEKLAGGISRETPPALVAVER